MLMAVFVFDSVKLKRYITYFFFLFFFFVVWEFGEKKFGKEEKEEGRREVKDGILFRCE